MRIRYTRRSQSDALAEARMQRAAEAGIPVRTDADCRRPIRLDLTSAGGPKLTLYPRRGYQAWRAVDDNSGEVVECAAIKALLHSLADSLPKTLGSRNLET